jgi:hypothetical protein
MSKTSIKRYLMLLGAIGLVAVAAGGGAGTFASFNAEVTNNGNYFATGSLVLNDNGGTNTCTSAGAATNLNNVTTNGCDTFFTVSKFTSPSAVTTTALTSGSTSIAFTGGLLNAAIDKGDTLTITDGTNTDTVIAAGGANVTGTSVAITAGPSHNYAIGSTVTDSSATYYAKLTLTNAGSLPASDIKVSMPTACATVAQEGTATLGTALTLGQAVTTLTVTSESGTFASGDPIVLTNGTSTQTFIANGAVSNGATSIAVQPAVANAAYSTTATISGPTFTPGGDLCGQLKMSIVETDSAFDNSAATNAKGCAYGVLDTTNATDGLGCTLASGTLLSSVLSTQTNLGLFSGGGTGNLGTQLGAGGSRFFLVAIKNPGGSFGNTFQNRKASFNLLWHIDQA